MNYVLPDIHRLHTYIYLFSYLLLYLLPITFLTAVIFTVLCISKHIIYSALNCVTKVLTGESTLKCISAAPDGRLLSTDLKIFYDSLISIKNYRKAVETSLLLKLMQQL